jgi:opacity protein-like surface antigen
MKKSSVIIFIILLAASASEAQTALSIYTGLGRSSYDQNFFGQGVDFSQSNYVPLGVQLTFGLPLISLGVEASYAVSPFSFDVNVNNSGTTANLQTGKYSIHQWMYGILGKVRLMSGPIVPYGRVGIDIYSGNADVDYQGRTLTVDFKSTVGFNLGAGVDINFTKSGGLFGELVYHFVSRERDAQGTQSYQANNYALHVGWQFIFD